MDATKTATSGPRRSPGGDGPARLRKGQQVWFGSRPRREDNPRCRIEQVFSSSAMSQVARVSRGGAEVVLKCRGSTRADAAAWRGEVATHLVLGTLFGNAIVVPVNQVGRLWLAPDTPSHLAITITPGASDLATYTCERLSHDPPQTVIKLAAQLTYAVHQLHRAGVLLNDLKLANVITQPGDLRGRERTAAAEKTIAAVRSETIRTHHELQARVKNVEKNVDRQIVAVKRSFNGKLIGVSAAVARNAKHTLEERKLRRAAAQRQAARDREQDARLRRLLRAARGHQRATEKEERNEGFDALYQPN